MSRLPNILPLLALALIAFAMKAHADVYVVDSAASSNVGACTSAPNDCPLGAAITLANGNAGADTITPAPSLTFIELDAALPTFTDSTQTTLTAPAGPYFFVRRNSGSFRIFNIAANGKLALSNVRLEAGNIAGSGGLVNNNGTLSASNCNFINGRAGAGGAIYNFGGSVTVQRSRFNNCHATDRGGVILNANNGGARGTVAINDCAFQFSDAAAGGAIFNEGDMAVRRSSFTNVRALPATFRGDSDGGAIISSGSLVLETSTFYKNSASRFGGSIYNLATMTVRSCTFASNSGGQGGAIANAGTGIVIGNTLFSSSTGDQNVRNIAGSGGSIESEGYNMSSDASGPAGSTDRYNTAALLPANLSGSMEGVQWLPLPRQSPAVDAGNTTLSPDTRGQSRPFDIATIANVNGGNGSDVGAFELSDPAPNFADQTLTIRRGQTQSVQILASDPLGENLTFDVPAGLSLPTGLSLSSGGLVTVDASVARFGLSSVTIRATNSQNASTTAEVTFRIIESQSLLVNTMGRESDFDGKTTLREAVAFARVDGTATPITFDESVFAAPRKTIAIVSGKIDLFDGELVTILGPSAGVEIRGDGGSELFFVGANGGLAIRGLTLTGGSSTRGGGILSYGDLSVDSCTFVGNRANGDGGAIYADFIFAGKKASIVNSTFSGNSAGGNGGAIYNATDLIDLDSLTIVNNSAQSNGGGGIAALSGFGTMTRVTNSLIVGNTSGGLPNDAQTIGGGSDPFQSGGFNRIGVGNASGAFNASGDSIGGDASNIGPLAENGGPTPTHALLPGNPAIDRGQTSLKFDQRGVARPQGSAADQGAYESVQLAVAVSLSPAAPKTTDILTATASASGEGIGAYAFAYEWRKNGVAIPNESSATLNLSRAGNGDKGDVVSVVVTATRADGKTGTGLRSVTVANSAPVAVSSQGVVDVDTEKGFPLLAFDADGDKLTYRRVGGPRNGVKADIRVDPTDGVTKLFYKSRPKYGGVDVIRFVVFDSDNKQSNESTLGIKVLYTPPPPVNRAPIAGNTFIDTYVNTSVIKGLLGSDPDGDPITFRIVNNARYGKSEIKQDKDGLFKLFYASLNRFYGNDSVTYIAVDKYGKESNFATVGINFTNRSPVAQGNKIAVAPGATVSQYLFGTDEDGDALTFRLVNNPRYGKGEVKRDDQGLWRFYYTSLPNYTGPDQITFIAIDPMGRESSFAAIDINVVRVGGSAPSALQGGVAASGGAS